MANPLQDQLDESAGKELVECLHSLSSFAICPSCGGHLNSLAHSSACGYGAKEAPLTPRAKYLAEFKALTDEMNALTMRKNSDYAGEADPYANFREFGTLGFLVRLSDKWQRLKTLTASGKKASVKDETVEDTLLDLATYSLLLITWLRTEKAQANGW